MKKITKKIAILITSVAVVLMILSQILFNNPLSWIYIPVWIIEARKGIDEEYNKAIKKEETNREENRVLAEKWLINTYGDIISEATTIEFSNRSQGWGIDSVFNIESPFATGSISVNSETKEVDGGFNLMSIKFQHLYSEWVKKQVGIDDENVMLEFKGALKSSAWVGENPYIEFDKITDLDNLEEDVCKNTHNLYINSVTLNNFYSVNIDNILKVVNGYEPLLKPYVFTDGYNELKFEVELEDLQNKQNNSYLCSIIFGYNINSKEESTKEIMGVYISDVENSKNAIRLICTEEQLNQINNHYNIIKELSNAVIPDYYVNCEVKHWLLPEDVIDEVELIKTPEGKYFQDYILRIDKSDVLKNEYVVDILYCDVANDIIAHDYNEKTKKYIPIKTYKAYKNGKRLDMYHNDISSKLLYKGKLRNPMFIRYVISQDNNSFRVIDKTDIYEKDYKGETFKYYYD